MKGIILAATLLSPALASILPSGLNTRQRLCNGHADLCNRKYSDVSFIGTHDSPFYGDEYDPRLTQDKSVPDQLAAGIRFLQSQTHKNPDNSSQLDMCHTSCLLESKGPVLDYLSSVKTFLDANPNEVVSLLMVNGDHVDVSMFGAVFQAAGLADYVFVPSSTSRDAWPTLGQMIDSKKRLVVSLDSGADQTKVNYILDEFTYYFETKYENYSPSDFAQCNSDRGNDNAGSKMYIMNHFRYNRLFNKIDTPDPEDVKQTNAATGTGSIGAQVAVCKAQWGGRAPNVVLVDFFDMGDVFAAQNAMNGLS